MISFSFPLTGPRSKHGTFVIVFLDVMYNLLLVRFILRIICVLQSREFLWKILFCSTFKWSMLQLWFIVWYGMFREITTCLMVWFEVLAYNSAPATKPPQALESRSFWKAGDYKVGTTTTCAGQGCVHANIRVSMFVDCTCYMNVWICFCNFLGQLEHARVHSKFLHSNATSHKWAFGGISYDFASIFTQTGEYK